MLLENKVLNGLTLYAQKRTLNIEEMIFSQEDQPGTDSTPVENSLEINIDRRPASRIIGQDLDLCPLRKHKMQKLTDSNIEKRMIRSRKLLSKYT